MALMVIRCRFVLVWALTFTKSMSGGVRSMAKENGQQKTLYLFVEKQLDGQRGRL